jgi:hypothetical protein
MWLIRIWSRSRLIGLSGSPATRRSNLESNQISSISQDSENSSMNAGVRCRTTRGSFGSCSRSTENATKRQTSLSGGVNRENVGRFTSDSTFAPFVGSDQVERDAEVGLHRLGHRRTAAAGVGLRRPYAPRGLLELNRRSDDSRIPVWPFSPSPPSDQAQRSSNTTRPGWCGLGLQLTPLSGGDMKNLTIADRGGNIPTDERGRHVVEQGAAVVATVRKRS